METALLVTTLLSIALAIAASLVAWRITRDNRRRSEARIAALAAEIGGARDHGQTGLGAAPALSVDSFMAEREPSALSHTALVVGAGAFVVGVLVALVVVTGGGASTPSPVAGETGDVASARALELVSLEHERQNDQLIVRGTLNNVPARLERDLLTAVVLFLGPNGDLVTNASATITSDSLTPDADGTFAVMVPDASEVGRYRVSFRTNDQVVPHVDRRSSR